LHEHAPSQVRPSLHSSLPLHKSPCFKASHDRDQIDINLYIILMLA
jgi:hypothetical protein